MYITIAILVVFSVVFAMFFAHAKTSAVTNYHKRQLQRADSKTKGKRRKIEMTPYNQRSFLEAKNQLKQKNPMKAAQIFESIGMTREAVKVLEHSGNIDAAARILIKVRAVERAGYIYARNKYWKKAAMCFGQADKKQESGLCLFENKSFEEAMEIFLETEDYVSAAKCAEALENVRLAALYHLKSDNDEAAARCYHMTGMSGVHVNELRLQSLEKDFLKQKVKDGYSGEGVVKMAAQASNNSVLILELCDENQVETLKSVLGYVSDADLDLMIRNLNADDPSSIVFANTLEAIGSYAFAGRLYEMLKEYDSAATCYKSAGLEDKYNSAIEQLKSSHSGGTNSSAPVFVLDVTGQNPAAEIEIEKPEEPTLQQNDEPVDPALLEYSSPNQAENPSHDVASEEVSLEYQSEPENKKLSLETSEPITTDDVAVDESPLFSLDEDLSLDSSPESSLDSSSDLDSLLVGGPSLSVEPLSLSGDFAEEKKPESKIKSLDDFISDAFKDSRLMEGFTGDELKKIWSMGEVMNVEAGNELVGYYVRPDGLYTVLSGQVIRYIQENDEDVFVSHVGISDSFGEFWLVGDLPNANMWKADVQTKVHILTTDQFSKLSQENPALATKIYKKINEKIFQMMSENPSLKTSFAS